MGGATLVGYFVVAISICTDFVKVRVAGSSELIERSDHRKKKKREEILWLLDYHITTSCHASTVRNGFPIQARKGTRKQRYVTIPDEKRKRESKPRERPGNSKLLTLHYKH